MFTGDFACELVRPLTRGDWGVVLTCDISNDAADDALHDDMQNPQPRRLTAEQSLPQVDLQNCEFRKLISLTRKQPC